MTKVSRLLDIYYKNNINLYIIIIVLITILQLIYILTTKFTKKITVEKVYNNFVGGSRYGGDAFMVHTTDGTIYQVTNSLWYWQWYSQEQWDKLKAGNTYLVEGYGFRVGFLNMFPKIINIKSI